MEGRDQHRALAERELASPQLRDPLFGFEEQLGGEVAERDHDRRVDEAQLALEVRPARLDLVRQRVAVARWAALDDVGDVDLVATQPDVGDEPGKELARPTDERDALAVLLRTRPLADEHEIRARIAVTEDDLAAALGRQGAFRAGERLSLELLERRERRFDHQRHARWYAALRPPRPGWRRSRRRRRRPGDGRDGRRRRRWRERR